MLSEYTPKFLRLLLGLLFPSLLVAAEKSAGQAAYEMNCMACHFVDARGVGPSLVKVAENYPVEELETFLAWVNSPGKKDPNMIQMPAMSHLSAEVVTGIHRYVLTATEGKVEKKGRNQFPGFKEPQRELPYVVRGFLPDSSPASVMVKLKGGLNVCWDTEACRFRYVWTGDQNLKAGSRTALKLASPPIHHETSTDLWSFGEGVKPEFRGYRLIEEYPEFDYAIGAIRIREKISDGSVAGTLLRQFKISGVTEMITLDLSSEGGARISSDVGNLTAGKLILTAAQAKSFTVKIDQR